MKDIMVKVGEYEKNGETKGEWVKVGVVMSNQNGEYLMLDPGINLAGLLIKQRILNPQKAGGMVLASLFEKQPQQLPPQQAAPQPASAQYQPGYKPQQQAPIPQPANPPPSYSAIVDDDIPHF